MPSGGSVMNGPLRQPRLLLPVLCSVLNCKVQDCPVRFHCYLRNLDD